jgi:AraC-like DNA-binding protein
MVQDLNWIGLLAGLLAFSGIIHLICFYLIMHPSVLYRKILWRGRFRTFPVKSSGPQVLNEEQLCFVPEQSLQEELQSVQSSVETGDTADKSAGQKVRISNEQAISYKQKIEEYFAESLAFRKPGYTIRDLAGETGIPVYLASLFINQEYGMNFNEWINAYRVAYLVSVFKSSADWSSYTLEAVGKMGGFNSRTAFIAAIKRHTGMTPSVLFGKMEGEKAGPSSFRTPGIVRKIA